MITYTAQSKAHILLFFYLGDSQPEEAHRGPHVPAQDRQAQLRRDGGAASGAWPN